MIIVLVGVFVLAAGCKAKQGGKPEPAAKAGKEPRAGGEAGKAGAGGSPGEPGKAGVGEGPRKAFEAFKSALSKDDADGIWAFISDKSRKWLVSGAQGQKMAAVKHLPDEILARLAHAAKTTVAELKKMNTVQLARAVMVAEAVKNKARVLGSQFKDAKVEGDRAVVTVTRSDGQQQRYVLIQEGGKWKLDGEETKKLELAKR